MACYGASFTIIYPTGNIHEPPRPVTGLGFLLYIPKEKPASLHGQLWGKLYYFIYHRNHLRASRACYVASFIVIYPTGNTYEPPRPVMGLALLLYIPQETPTSLHCQLCGWVYYYISHRKHLRDSMACYIASFTIIYHTGNTYEPPWPVSGLGFLLYIPKEKPASIHGLLWG
jgi:hypothetical protein